MKSNEADYNKYHDCQKFDKGTCFWVTKYYGINFAAKAMCPDGKVRMMRTAQQPCMFGAIDARVTMPNKQTVRGRITLSETFNTKVLVFHPWAWKITWVKPFGTLGNLEVVTEWFSSEKNMLERTAQLWNNGKMLTDTCHTYEPNGDRGEWW